MDDRLTVGKDLLIVEMWINAGGVPYLEPSSSLPSDLRTLSALPQPRKEILMWSVQFLLESPAFLEALPVNRLRFESFVLVSMTFYHWWRSS